MAGTVARTTATVPAVLPTTIETITEKTSTAQEGVTTLTPPANDPIPRNQKAAEPSNLKKKTKPKKLRPKRKPKSRATTDDDTNYENPTTKKQAYSGAENAPPPRRDTPLKRVVPPMSPDEGKLAVLEKALQVFQDVLGALREGSDPVSAVLRGMTDLLQLYGS